MHVYETEPYLTLNSKSPSGNKTPAASDTVMKFDIKANSREKVKIEKISFALASNAVFDTTPATTVTAYLKNISSSSRSGKIVASGRVDIVSTSLATVELLPIGILEIPKGTTVTYSLELNTQSMITQSVNDDLLTPSLSVSIIPGMNGGFWWNDTNNTVKWVDAASVPNGSFDLKGHTLTY